MRAKILIVFIALVFAFTSVSASVINFNLSLPSSSFGPNQVIDALINLSLKNVSANTPVVISITSAQYKKEVKTTLLQFLEKLNAQKTCVPANCLVTYSISSEGVSEKNLAMQADQESLIAFKIPSGNNVEIQNFSFKITGNTLGNFSCEDSIIKFDLLDDNSIDWEYINLAEEKNCSDFVGGCFVNMNTQELYLDTMLRCEKIRIGKTGKADLGVFVTLSNPENPGTLLLLLYDPVTRKKYNCSIEEAQSGFNFCSIDYSNGFFINESRDVFVCVKAISGSYTIKVETDSPCGFYGNPEEWQGNFSSDYPLYLRYYGFSSMAEEFVFNNESFVNGNLKDYLQNYIDSRYVKDCSSGCVIPVRFIAKAYQEITLSQPLLEYTHVLGRASNNYFYNAIVNYPRVDVSQQLSLAALNVTAPEREGNYTLKLSIGSYTKQLSFRVEPVPIPLSVSPLFVVPGKETTFYVTVQQVTNPIVSYVWQWGDNSQDETTVPEARHTYAAGTYTLTIIVKDSSGLQGSRSFIITSNITREFLNFTINNLISRINALTLQYNSLDPWYRELLGLNLTQDNATLFELKSKISTIPETQFETIKTRLDEIASRNPLNITDSFKLIESLYYPDPDKIDPSYVAEITGESYNANEKEKYQNAIALWQEQNVDIKVQGFVKAFVYETEQQDKITIINIKLEPKASIDKAYLIFLLPSGISYSNIKVKQGNFEVQNVDNAIGFSLNLRTSETISIALPSKQNFMDLKFYVSPPLRSLVTQPSIPSVPRKTNNLLIFLIIIIAIAVAIGLFFIWSRSKAESKLFKSETDLMSLINFISMSLAQGMPKNQIQEQLLNAGWSKKQIKYAFKEVEKPKHKFERFKYKF